MARNINPVINNCIFCSIVSRKAEATIKYEDDAYLAFKDIYPASDTHILIIPKRHIKDIKSLTTDDLPIIERMKDIAINLIRENALDSNDTRLGFHKPPFNSISHLHLHLISPVSNMSFIKKAQFRPGSFWFTELAPFMESLQNSS
ncbi:histidine triad nucleotide-binding protein 3 isoform X2 [Tetranychus urticae]|nr:histidine triad nucleotide-binding protein 3 isoform X2 [Tetranychus urticae]